MKSLSFFALVVICLTSCVSGRMWIETNTEGQQVTVSKVYLFDPKSSEQYQDTVRVSHDGLQFSIQSHRINVHLVGLYRPRADKDLFIGQTKEGIEYVLYYYTYRDKLRIKLVPIRTTWYADTDTSEELVWLITN